MNGKIIQEAEGIVNGSGFTKMVMATYPTNGSKTLNTDFTPKIVFALSNEEAGFAIKPSTSLQSAKMVLFTISDISWGDASISFHTQAGTTVLVMG